MFNDAPPRTLPRAGEILAGRYEIGELLGAGGMGVVVAARHLELRREVAIKLLHPELTGATEAVARFLREARLMAALQGEHVTRVYDVGRLEGGAPYMVMERLHGTDLHKVARRGAMPIEEAIDTILQAGEAVAEAHAQGIVHRDLKPANLFVAARVDGSTLIKVLDFGISKLVGAARPGGPEVTLDGGLTAPATLMGTPHFISPEQIFAAHTVDHRTDVWALGAILHRLIAGSVPFDAADSVECLRKVMLEPPTPLRERCPAAPPALEAVILRCLEKDPDDRMPSVAALAAALAPFAPARSRISVERILKLLGAPSPEAPSAPIEEPRASAPPAPPAPFRVPSPNAAPIRPSTPAPGVSASGGATSSGLRWRSGPAPGPAPRPPPQGPPTAGLRLRPRKPDPA
jgi:serine/threonine-protein kinase